MTKVSKIFHLYLFSVFFVLFSVSCFANNLEIKNVRYFANRDSKGEHRVIFDLSWQNAWRNSRNYDAAWVFLKFPLGNGDTHAKLAADGHAIIQLPNSNSPKAKIDVGKDGNGFFIYPAENFRGNINWRVNIKLNLSKFGERIPRTQPKIFGIEMVYIPKGSFTLGEPSEKALNYGAFYRSNANGEPSGLVEINSESAINVSASDGSLYYRKATYVGDQKGPIPATFPKGFNAFYAMKYELTQGFYAYFLNSISSDATFERVNFGGRDYFENKGTIKLKNGHYIAEKPNQPMNFITWDDGLAFADWAALRPMTELEFTKAGRGSRKPSANEFPWGTNDSKQLARIVDSENNLTLINNWTEDKLSNQTLSFFGASYFWVMDLSGSLWERVITIGSPDGRAFKGTHGDGELGERGDSTNEDWSQTKRNKNGHGYRGGGFYFQGRAEHEFNPYSPIAYRRFGGWSGADSHIAYGFRCVRTAE